MDKPASEPKVKTRGENGVNDASMTRTEYILLSNTKNVSGTTVIYFVWMTGDDDGLI